MHIKQLLLGLVFSLISISFSVALQISGGNYEVRVISESYNFTSISDGTFTLNATALKQPVGKYISGNFVFILGTLTSSVTDFIEPQIDNVSIQPIAYLNENVTYDADIWDNIGLNEVWGNVTFPSEISHKNSSIFPDNFTTSELGQYNITFNAKDLSENLASETYYLNVTSPVDFSTNITKKTSENVSMIFYYNSLYQRTNESNETITLRIPEQTYDITYKTYSNTLTILFDNIDTSNIGSINLSLDKLTNQFSYLNIYAIGPDYNNTIPTINITYSNFKCENVLTLYQCTEWNFSSRSCSSSWSLTSGTQNTNTNIFTITPSKINSTYAFGIKDGLCCGDSICNNGETCSSCSNDCGECEEEPILITKKGGSSVPPPTIENIAQEEEPEEEIILPPEKPKEPEEKYEAPVDKETQKDRPGFLVFTSQILDNIVGKEKSEEIVNHIEANFASFTIVGIGSLVLIFGALIFLSIQTLAKQVHIETKPISIQQIKPELPKPEKPKLFKDNISQIPEVLNLLNAEINLNSLQPKENMFADFVHALNALNNNCLNTIKLSSALKTMNFNEVDIYEQNLMAEVLKQNILQIMSTTKDIFTNISTLNQFSQQYNRTNIPSKWEYILSLAPNFKKTFSLLSSKTSELMPSSYDIVNKDLLYPVLDEISPKIIDLLEQIKTIKDFIEKQ